MRSICANKYLNGSSSFFPNTSKLFEAPVSYECLRMISENEYPHRNHREKSTSENYSCCLSALLRTMTKWFLWEQCKRNAANSVNFHTSTDALPCSDIYVYIIRICIIQILRKFRFSVFSCTSAYSHEHVIKTVDKKRFTRSFYGDVNFTAIGSKTRATVQNTLSRFDNRKISSSK